MEDSASIGTRRAARAGRLDGSRPDHYKWIALTNTTLGVLLVSINESILIIALPAIFRGIRLNPLVPGNSFYLLWILLGFMLVTAVLVVTLGRIGDMYGRVRMYNLGFVIFTVFSVLLSVNWLHGSAGGTFIIAMRIGQGIGGSFLFANSSAILTDAFPQNQRGLALGINNIAGIAGAFIGLVVGGLLAPIDWRLVFIVSAPFGVIGTLWAYLQLRDNGVRTPARIDWWGNILFAVGLTLLLVGITYGIQPYGTHAMGWTSPKVLSEIGGGVLLLIIFGIVESRVASPMFQIGLFRIRAFLAGNVASLLAAIGRGGLMFLFVIWLQGIWLPLHGYSFSQTPLWAGIYMLPMTAGFLLAGPLSGILSDHYGARPFATTGMVAAALTFIGFDLLPINFAYLPFALLMLANGLAMGLFASPNRAAIMNSLPPHQRGVGAGMAGVFQNAAMVLSMGIFFSLMISGIATRLPDALYQGLLAQHVPVAVAARVSHLPPITSMFAALLGYDPMQSLLGSSVLAALPAHSAAVLSGRAFFPTLLSGPFSSGLNIAFTFGAIACVLAALASLLRGGKYVHGAETAAVGNGTSPALAMAGASAAGSVVSTIRPDAGYTLNGRARVAYDASSGGGPTAMPSLNGSSARQVAVAEHASVGGRAHASPDIVTGTDSVPMPSGVASRVAVAESTGGILHGRVVSIEDQAIAGALLTLVASDGTQSGRTATGEDGSYSFESLSQGDYTLIVAAPGYAPLAEALEIRGGQSTERVFCMLRAGRIAGCIRLAGSRAPVVGARVSVADASGRVIASTRSGKDGRYELRGLHSGDHVITVESEHYRPVTKAVTLPLPAGTEWDIDLAGRGSLAGVVRAPSGTPLAEMIVTVTDAEGRVVASAATDAEGRYAVSELEEGEYTVVATGYPPRALSVPVTADCVAEADVQIGGQHG